ncbi:MAG: 23S rRNA (uracil(1939)-C(5))-methyltransferase RlmD [Clostridia bacterium]|nr:23S rRNA (uracil(1939)-C(5))-methyltransferase RlmD [Clostridia bacterium]
MKKNEIVHLEIEDLNNLGFGVSHVEGKVVFVSGAVTGDVVEAQIIKRNASYCVAIMKKLLSPSPLRTEGRCPYRACTACAYKNIGYEHEKKTKEANVRATFKKAGLSGVTVLPVLSTGVTEGYRNKAQYPVGMDREGNFVFGFYAPKSHTVKEAAACPLQPAIFAEILEFLRVFFKKHAYSVYDEKSGKGLLRHVYLRRAEQSGEILLTLVVNGSQIPDEDVLVCELTAAFPALVGILLNENREDTNVILSNSYRTLYGKNYITDTLAGVTLEIAASAFYQVNRRGAELLYGEAKKLAGLKKSDLLLDLYCGTGAIGLSMAREVRELIGIEIVPDAVECAKRNAAASGIANASFFVGDAADAERILENAERARGEKLRPDVVILDPPRKGCDSRLLSFVASLSPRTIVYVSCNPDTLARDVAILAPLGYTTDKVQPVDMFPGTGHVESVVCLTRRLDVDMRR